MQEQVLNSYLLSTFAKDKWRKVGTQKRAGFLVPLFSVHSKSSLGIGDFHDLKLLVDLSKKCGNSIIQLLPINELGAGFCPYDAVSSFALEPAFVSFEFFPGDERRLIKEEADEIRQVLPAGKPHINYRIKEEKSHLLFDVFSRKNDSGDRGLATFKKENAYWIEDFALFKALKELHNGLPWFQWEEKYKNRDKSSLERFTNIHREKIDFHIWVQWQAFKQLKEVKDYAAKKGILVKGDLPILVSRDSADVWSHPEFFKLDFAAGAPPDMYCAKGQRWGMPTYDWGRIAEDNFKYLKEKLRYAENFYDILRVDHVVGLFRIWSIPYNEPQENQGLNGFFDPREEEKWGEHGRGLLSAMLENTSMLLCAEDLGVIPKVCTDTLKEFGIPGNDVQRWVKDWSVKHDFLLPQEYRQVSATMLSTHDTTNWQAWWQYEAGTIDEALFIRKCNDRSIDYTIVRDRLFDLDRSFHGRLRWLDTIKSVDLLVSILGRRREEVGDFIDLYLNTFQEKEKLWKILGMKGRMQEEASRELTEKILKFNLDSGSIFSIQLITDWLGLADILKGDPYQYRINFPGTTSPKNWSVAIPIPLEDLMKHRVVEKIRKMVTESGRI